MTHLLRHLATLLLAAVAVLGTWPARAAGEFQCGGAVEADTWRLWTSQSRDLIGKALIEGGLKAHGDTYVLYDLQGYLQNLVAMGARCGRTAELRGIARFLAPLFDELVDLPGGAGKAWVCRGGRVCNAANGLQGAEVVLTSSQYLALVMRVASALLPLADGDAEVRGFIDQATRTTVSHLDRWANGKPGLRINERLAARPSSVRDGGSQLFYNDTDLWMLALHAEVAGVVQARDGLNGLLDSPRDAALRRRDAVVGLLRLLEARSTTRPVDSRWTGKAIAADLDRGFWRLYVDNRFAGFEGARSPAACAAGPDNLPVREQPVETVGWDLSHARRLVHAFDAIDRQRDAVARQYQLAAAALPPPTRAREFAAQLVTAVWNGDTELPLFRNYWDGSNGWYRAGYTGGGRSCFEGYPPFGLTDAFPTGGFAVWSVHYPVLGRLSERLYHLVADQAPVSAAFIAQHYPGLSPSAPSSTRILNRLMFWPSLVRAADTNSP